MTTALYAEGLSVRGFRNLSDVQIRFSPRINVISGDNGQGKTSVLEALYLVATTRSFRTDALAEAYQENADTTRIEVQLSEAGIVRRQRFLATGGRRTFSMGEKRATRYSTYALATPVVVFHPGDLQLVSGPAGGRRTLLDRLGFFYDPSAGDAKLRYSKAQRERQLVLERRGVHAVELDAFEAIMAAEGARLTQARVTVCAALETHLTPAFNRVSPRSTSLSVQYLPGGSAETEPFLEELRKRRSKDQQRRTATFGPQRDDIELLIAGRSARRQASQGQQRLLALALKIAELGCVQSARATHPILLLDDVSSELDPERTGAVYDLVRHTESQVLVTTTRPELFDTSGLPASERVDFRLHEGQLVETQ